MSRSAHRHSSRVWTTALAVLILFVVAGAVAGHVIGVQRIEVLTADRGYRGFGWDRLPGFEGLMPGGLTGVGYSLHLGWVDLLVIVPPTPADQALMRSMSRPIRLPTGQHSHVR